MLDFIRLLKSSVIIVSLTLVCALIVLVVGFLGLISGKRVGPGDSFGFAARVRRWWASAILFLHGIRIQVDGPGKAELLSPEGLIITSNHQSALDIFVSSLVCPNNSFFLAKRELLLIPFFGWAAALGHTVFVDRRQGVKDEAAIESVRKLLARGDNLIIYPEGTRSRSRKMGKFKRGAFVMAIQLQKAVLPMSIQNSIDLTGRFQLSLRPGVLRVWIDRPVPVSGLSLEDRFDLAEKLQKIIQSNLESSSEGSALESKLDQSSEKLETGVS